MRSAWSAVMVLRTPGQLTVFHEYGFEHVGDKAQDGCLGPKRTEGAGFGGLQPLRDCVAPPENAGAAYGPVTNGNGRSGRSSILGSISRTMAFHAWGESVKTEPRSPESAGWLIR